MPTPVHAVVPKWVQFEIGRSFTPTITPGTPPAGPTYGSAVTPVIGIVKRDSIPVSRTVMGLVENFGDAALTIEIDESANNNLANIPGLPSSADAYADRAIRVDGSAVAGGTITVQPGGKVVFTIEMTATSDRYLRFQTATATPNAHGRLTLAHFDGTLEVKERESVP